MVGIPVKQPPKRFLLYGLITVVLITAISLLLGINIGHADSYYYLALVLVLILGGLHLFFMYKYLPHPTPDEFWWGLLFTFILMLLGAIAIAIVYHFIRLDYLFITFVTCFILPYLFWQSYRFFFKIPAPVFKLWYYPVNEAMPDLDMIDLSQIEVVQFVFNKKPGDKNPTSFTSKAPLNMTLGQLFFIFINDYNEKNAQNTIEFLDPQQQPYGWLFYRKKKWYKRNYYFDPDSSFHQNSIQPHEFIYSVRIPVSTVTHK